MNDENLDQWWLARVGDLLIWGRLRIRPSGTAEVLDSSGNILNDDSGDSARAALMDAEFRALDGMDEDDALALGIASLQQLTPPQGDEAELHQQMVLNLPPLH